MSRKRIQMVTVVSAAALAIGLIVAAPSDGQPEDPQAMSQFIGLMSQYLELSQRFVEMSEQPQTASYLAIEGIVEIYEAEGRKGAAIPHLERILAEEADSRAVRNAIRFKLRDLHKERGDTAEALAQLDRIVHDNAG